MAFRSVGPADKQDRNRFAALAFSWGDLLFELDVSGSVVFCAGPVTEFTRIEERRIVGMSFFDLVVPADMPMVAEFLKGLRNRERAEGDIIHIKRGGATLPVSLAGYCMDDRFFIALRLRTGKLPTARADSEIPDSGLLNQDVFARHASERIKELEKRGQTAEFTVLDLAGLADLKDSLTQDDSHRLLSSVGACLRQHSLAGETATQIGGEAFGVVHDTTLDVLSLQTRLQSVMASVTPGANSVRIGHSTMALDSARGVNEDDLAKGLMYALGNIQKQSGSKVAIADITSNISNLISQGISDVRDFRKILSNRSFVVALQPIIDIRNGGVHHFEALCRFDAASPDQSPYRFITFAEETGLVHEFDLAMAAKVISWLRKMPVNNQKFSVAINISGYSIGVPEYVKALHAMLKRYPDCEGRLMFEITESSRMSDLEAANSFIQSLRRMGYKVCLDDFGAGAASFQYLSALEIDVVKIDGSAVRNAQKALKGRAFLSALTEFCTRLGVETIAEMIDSPESLRFVRDCRCDYVQGFLFGKPSRNIADFSPLPNVTLFQQ